VIIGDSVRNVIEMWDFLQKTTGSPRNLKKHRNTGWAKKIYDVQTSISRKPFDLKTSFLLCSTLVKVLFSISAKQ
jgi:hypothetical protein